MAAIYHTNAGAQTFTASQAAQIEEYTANILAAYERRTAQNELEGAAWYDYAESFARQIAEDCGITQRAAAGVIAVTSNNVPWARQVQWTAPLIRDLLAGKSAKEARGPFIGACKEKAARLLAGDETAVSGAKVTAFWANIAGDKSMATVDRWAVRVALAVDFTNDSETSKWMRGTRREMLDAAYHEAARIAGIEVAVLQAITWCVVRGTGA